MDDGLAKEREKKSACECVCKKRACEALAGGGNESSNYVNSTIPLLSLSLSLSLCLFIFSLLFFFF